MARRSWGRLAELRRAADCCRDVGAHLGEGIAAAFPGLVLVVAGDEVGAEVADGEFGKILGRSTSAFNTRAEAKAGDRFTAAALTLPKFLDAITRKTKTLRKLQGGTSWNFGRPFYSG